MMPLSLSKCFGARRGASVRKKVCGMRMKLFSHPFLPWTLPSTACEAGANEGASVRKKFRRVRIELSHTELFSVLMFLVYFTSSSHHAIYFVCFQELFRDTSPYWDLVLMDFIYTDHSPFILFISSHFIQKVCTL